MGITILNSDLASTLAIIRKGGLPTTLSITYASEKSSHPGMTYLENGQELAALLRKGGLSSGQVFRVQWAISPKVPISASQDVSSALAAAGFGGAAGVGAQYQPVSIGAQAFSLGNDISFGSQPDHSLLSHELVHAVQQMHGPSRK
jgi:hypothetical protein